MPFKALCKGEPVISLDFFLPDWDVQKARHKAGYVSYFCPECGELMTLATSNNSVPFFKHYPNADCPNSKTKSPEHVRLQIVIYQLCKKYGWSTDIEAIGDGWRADVLASNDQETYAFEVQLSSISGKQLEERSKKYRAEKISPVWLLADLPTSSPFDNGPYYYRFWYLHDSTYRSTLKAWNLSNDLAFWKDAKTLVLKLVWDSGNYQWIKVHERWTILIDIIPKILEGLIGDEMTDLIRQKLDSRDWLLSQSRKSIQEYEQYLSDLEEE
jgi:hypothetical protein